MIKLNDNGMSVWCHNTNKNLFAERSYEWVDRLIIIDETENRSLVDDVQFSTFDFSEWTPMTLDQYLKVERNYKEIYND
jgi:hypothetical protein